MKSSLVVLATLLVAVASCATSDDAPPEVRFLTLGDSLTYGVGAPNPETGSWPALVTAKWRAKGCNVVFQNAATIDATTVDVSSGQVVTLLEFNPTLVTLQIGANDIARKISRDDYKSAVETILRIAKRNNARVIVFPQNEWFRSPEGAKRGDALDEHRLSFDRALAEAAFATGAEVINLHDLFKSQADAKMWHTDNLNPNAAAYQAWADEVVKAIPNPCAK